MTIGGKFLKNLTVGDHFGEMSIVTGELRYDGHLSSALLLDLVSCSTATITAVTAVEAVQFSKSEFLHLVR